MSHFNSLPAKANTGVRTQRHRGPVTTLVNRQLYPHSAAFQGGHPPVPTSNSPIEANMGARVAEYRGPLTALSIRGDEQEGSRALINEDDVLLERMAKIHSKEWKAEVEAIAKAAQRVLRGMDVIMQEVDDDDDAAVKEADEDGGYDADDDRTEDDDVEMGEAVEMDVEVEMDEGYYGDDDDDSYESLDPDTTARYLTPPYSDDPINSPSDSPVLGLRGGNAPNTYRADLELAALLKISQRLNLLSGDGVDEAEDLSVEDLRAMIEEQVALGSDSEPDEEVEALRRQIEEEIDREQGTQVEDDEEDDGEVEILGPDGSGLAAVNEMVDEDRVAADDRELDVGEEPKIRMLAGVVCLVLVCTPFLTPIFVQLARRR